MGILHRKLTPFIGLGLGGGEAGPPPARPIADALRRDLAALAGAPRRYAAALGDTLSTRRERALILELPERTVTFAGLTEFEFALESRTEFPVGKIGELMARPPEELRRLASNIRQVEKRFAEVLTQSLAEPTSIGELMRELEIKLFSQDHGWRDIAEALNRREPAYDPYKRVALVKYMQYLASRQSVIRSIYMRHPPEAAEADGSRGRAKVASGAVVAAARGSAESDATQMVGMRETAIFDLTSAEPEAGPGLAAMPRGETVCVHLPQNADLPIRLASHAFRLRAGARFQLLDEAGASYLLDSGRRNVVGRQAENDVVIDATYRAISRKHLVVEPVSDSAVLLTDISSHGTFVPREVLRPEGVSW